MVACAPAIRDSGTFQFPVGGQTCMEIIQDAALIEQVFKDTTTINDENIVK
jgi:hypothetical protein